MTVLDRSGNERSLIRFRDVKQQFPGSFRAIGINRPSLRTAGQRFKVLLYLLWSGSPPPGSATVGPAVREPAAVAATDADAAVALTSCGVFGVGGGLATVNVNKPAICQFNGVQRTRPL